MSDETVYVPDFKKIVFAPPEIAVVILVPSYLVDVGDNTASKYVVVIVLLSNDGLGLTIDESYQTDNNAGSGSVDSPLNCKALKLIVSVTLKY
jgi:hypothetical protein